MNTIYFLLNNEKYTGVYRFGNKVFTETYPQIIPVDLYKTVKTKLDANRHGNNDRPSGRKGWRVPRKTWNYFAIYAADAERYAAQRHNWILRYRQRPRRESSRSGLPFYAIHGTLHADKERTQIYALLGNHLAQTHRNPDFRLISSGFKAFYLYFLFAWDWDIPWILIYSFSAVSITTYGYDRGILRPL